MITLVNGRFQYANGSPINGFRITFNLSADSLQPISSPDGQVCGGAPVSFTAASGSNNMPSGSLIWSNLTISPVGTFYVVNLYDSNGTPVWKNPQVWTFTAADGSTVDVGSLSEVGQYGQFVFNNPAQSAELVTIGVL